MKAVFELENSWGNDVMTAPHLNPLPAAGERRINVHFTDTGICGLSLLFGCAFHFALFPKLTIED
jgi:hypothetical protein